VGPCRNPRPSDGNGSSLGPRCTAWCSGRKRPNSNRNSARTCRPRSRRARLYRRRRSTPGSSSPARSRRAPRRPCTHRGTG
jgi:hypothetical protein